MLSTQFSFLIATKTSPELAQWMFKHSDQALDCVQDFFNSFEQLQKSLGKSTADNLLSSLEHAMYILDGYLQDDAVMYQELAEKETSTVPDYYQGDRRVEVVTFSDRYTNCLNLIEIVNKMYQTI